jgi:hypothetical protein
MKRFQVLDGFRGICALSVAVYHMHIPQSFGEWAFFRNAHHMVSFFFVLSGFVMVHTYGQRLATTDQFRQFSSLHLRLHPCTSFVLRRHRVGGCEAREHAGIAFNQPSFTGIEEIILTCCCCNPGGRIQSASSTFRVEYQCRVPLTIFAEYSVRVSMLIFLVIPDTWLASPGLAFLMEPACKACPVSQA